AEDRRLGGQAPRHAHPALADVDVELLEAEADQRHRERLVALAELLDRDPIAAPEAELRRVDARRDLRRRRDRPPQLDERSERLAAQDLAGRRIELAAARPPEQLPALLEHLALIHRRRAERLEPDQREPARVDVALPAGDLREPVVEHRALGVLDDRRAE